MNQTSVDGTHSFNNRRGFKHGMHGTSEYWAWQGMLKRCHHKNATTGPDAANYAGKGVQVCARWREAFANFYADVGPKPSAAHSLDRFPNPDGDYEPSNVRWATAKEQARNWSTRNRKLTFQGETLTIVEWTERLQPVLGISQQRIYHRLDDGWSVARTLTTPAVRVEQRTRTAVGKFTAA